MGRAIDFVIKPDHNLVIINSELVMCKGMCNIPTEAAVAFLLDGAHVEWTENGPNYIAYR